MTTQRRLALTVLLLGSTVLLFGRNVLAFFRLQKSLIVVPLLEEEPNGMALHTTVNNATNYSMKEEELPPEILLQSDPKEKLEEKEALEAEEEAAKTATEPPQIEAIDQEKVDPQESEHTNLADQLLSYRGLKSQLEKARANFRQHMDHLYGSYYSSMFEPDGISIGRYYLFKSPGQLHTTTSGKPVDSTSGHSWNGLVRKLHIKLLQVQLGILHQKLQKEAPQSYYARYLWITGGDNTAAGFGNLHHQTYTSVLQDAVQEVFGNLGIEFVARNHALRGQESAPEVALCAGALFGTDFDSLVWDFESLDYKETWLRGLYAHRAAVSSAQRPALFLYAGPLGQGPRNHKKDTLYIAKQLEQLGMPILINDPQVESQLLQQTPDSTWLTDQQVQTTYPPNLQFLRCNKDIEKNDGKQGGKGTGNGHCSNFQFNQTICKRRGDMKDWFPGWKTHAIKGYAFAMTMMEALSDAVELVGGQEESDLTSAADPSALAKAKERIQKQLQDLLLAEEQEYKAAVTSNTLAVPNSWRKQQASMEIRQHFNLTTIFHSPALCRTPLMPSNSRLRGILTDKPVVYGEGYEEGIDLRAAQTNATEGNHQQLPVVTNPKKERVGCKEPEVTATQEKSFRDFYYVSSSQGWQGLTIPNNAEQQHYKDFDVRQSQGWIILCLLKCIEKRCTEDMVLKNTLRNHQTQIEMEVNGVSVVGFAQFLSHTGNCRALQHADDDRRKQFTWTRNAEGRYVIRMRIKDAVPTAQSHFKISSFILM